MTQGHLADDRLIDLCLGAPITSADRTHLVGCVSCERRRLTLERMLDDTAAAATLDAETAFPAERLARQQARILQRIEQDGRPGRIIAFPAAHLQDVPTARSARRSSPWVAAAAAAAGLAVGLLAGHLSDLPGVTSAPDRVVTSSRPATGPLRPAVLSDDEFLGQLELAVGSATPAVLNPLDALTPGAADVGR